ncbi:MAG TPA: glycosyltransferase family 4 protein [Candidatus Krumholzibacteria bacterium]|nr:glycosyltransferase family 4 protein [Candidatus Krumholzibacteria bacterium]
MPERVRFSSSERVVIVVNEDWMFWSHRLALARAARAAGARVTVATRVDRHADRIREEGFVLEELPWRRGSRHPLGELQALAALVALYRRECPAVVHHVGIKAALYGATAALAAGAPAQIHTIAGFGFVSVSTRRRARALRAVLGVAFRRILSRPRSHLVVQNHDDLDDVRAGGLFAPERTHLVPGSGVDTHAFHPMPEPPLADGEAAVALLASRLIRPKGIVQMVAAARFLRARGAPVRVVLVGDPDPENPDTVTAAELGAWRDEGLIEWRPRAEDMPAVWASCHIAVLPSYREGMPRALLEAAACGRPLVATDVPGCRDLVRPGDNGLLVPLHDAAALAGALVRLAEDHDLRRRMGARAREIVESTYSDELIVARMLALYRIAAGATEDA